MRVGLDEISGLQEGSGDQACQNSPRRENGEQDPVHFSGLSIKAALETYYGPVV